MIHHASSCRWTLLNSFSCPLPGSIVSNILWHLLSQVKYRILGRSFFCAGPVENLRYNFLNSSALSHNASQSSHKVLYSFTASNLVGASLFTLIKRFNWMFGPGLVVNKRIVTFRCKCVQSFFFYKAPINFCEMQCSMPQHDSPAYKKNMWQWEMSKMFMMWYAT